jgi:DNA-binding IclR family transcriptional regulator
MSIIKAQRIARAINGLRIGDLKGEVIVTSGAIAWYCRIPKSTTYRHLNKMEEFGLVEKSCHHYKNTFQYSWFMTKEGQEWLNEQKKLI